MGKISILVSFFLGYSCLVSGQKNGQSVYPLNIGNSWTYTFNNMRITESIVDTINFEGNPYYGLSYYNDIPELWMREDSNSVYILNRYENIVFKLFDFSSNPGDNWELPDGYECSFGTKIQFLNSYDTIQTSNKIFNNCFHFLHEPNCADAGIYETWISAGVGKVAFNETSIAGPREFLLEEYSLITSAEQNRIRNSSTAIELFQNYPNPANSSTKIKFILYTSGYVKLSVVDVLGKIKNILVDEYLVSGEYEKTLETNKYSSGVYFFQLENSGHIRTKKLIILN